MYLLKKIKFKLAKSKIKLTRRLHPPHVPNQNEEKVIVIIKTLIKDHTSVMLVAPISGKKYIKSEKRGMFVIINDTDIILSNNIKRYYYSLTVNESVAIALSRNFDNVLESRRHKMEIDTIAGITSNLDFISKHMNDEIEKETISV